MRPRVSGLLCAVGALAIGSIASSASASYSFSQITSNGNTPVAGQFTLDVIDHGTSVGLKVSNAGPVASTIAGFYVDDDAGAFTAITDYVGTGTVNFGAPPPGPDDLPSGNTVGFAANYTATANPPPATNGVDPGEAFELQLALAGGMTITDVINDLGAGTLRVGLHVISIDNAGSESFVNNGGNLPTPGALALAGCALLCTPTRRRRR